MLKTIRARLFATLFIFSLLILISWTLNYALVKEHQQDEEIVDLVIRKISLLNQINIETDRTEAAVIESFKRQFEETLQVLEDGGEFITNDGSVMVYTPLPEMGEPVEEVREAWGDYLNAWLLIDAVPEGSSDFIAAEMVLLDATNAIDASIFNLLAAFEHYSLNKHNRLLSLNVGVIILALTTLAVSISFIHFRITAPIRSLTQAVLHFSKGIMDSEPEANISGSDDEITGLSAAFGVMRAEIMAHQAELESNIDLRIKEITTAFEISQDIVIQQDIDQLLTAVKVRIKALMTAHTVNICLIRPLAEPLPEQAAIVRNQQKINDPRAYRIGLERPVQEGQRIETVRQCDCRGLDVLPDGQVFATPLRVGQELLGEICIFREVQTPLGENEKRAFKLLANAIAIAIQNARLMDQVRQQAYMSAQLNERKRVASDLHDNLAQTLNLLYMQTEELRDALPAEKLPQVPEKMADIRSNLSTALEQVRLAISGEDPRFNREDVSLEKAFLEVIDEFSNENELEIRYHDPERQFVRFEELVQKQVIYIVREALTNIHKHARASQVDIHFTHGGEFGNLTIQDDGIGFDPGIAQGDHHLGLKIMKARAERMNGTLNMQSKPGQGTLITAQFPLSPEKSEAV